VQEDELGETHGFARHTLDSGVQHELFAFNLLRLEFTHGMTSRGKVLVRDSGRIGIKGL
jgi:hypothetical protein